ncbi:MAG: gliding motility-associated protein GldE [Bacteroidetes bacterium]|nr:gliding motility-associated protein GldE [Bacteroidota bacterium]
MEAVPEDPFPGILLFLEQTPALFYSINGIVLLTLLLLSGLISGSEVAFFSLSSNEIEEFRDHKNRNLNKIARLLENPKKLLATILILNNFINIAIVTLSTFLSWQIVGSKSPRGIVIVILTFLVTFAIVFIGEVVPKVYANQNNLTFARITAPLLNFFQSILHPLSWLLMSISHVIEKRVERKGYDISVDELNQALEITTGDETSEEEKGILKGIVNFGTLTVTQVMRSRLDITAFDMEIDFHDLMDTVNKTGYSRIPVFNETIDKIEGILYIKDLLPYLDSDEQFAWQKLLRPGYFVPESKKIDALLKDFQEKRVHMAIIVDEYGGTTGLITLEDIIEEIVGEIKDEFDDDDDVAYHMIDNNTYVFEGKTSLNDFCKIVGEDVSIFEDVKGESESLGGLILEIHSKLPRVGEKINFDRFVFTVVSVDTKRIKRVRVFINEPSQQKRAHT